MNFITSAIDRLARAVGMASESGESQHRNYQSRDIIHTAFLLHQKLPADLVPMILEYAELWQTFRLDSPQVPERRVTQHDSPRLQAGAIVPYQIPRGHIRLIRFITVSKDQGWSSDDREHHNTYKNSWSWFEAGIVEPMTEVELDCGHERYDSDHLRQCEAKPSNYKWDSKRIVTNVHAGREYQEHVVEWRGDDDYTRQILREIKGGYGIEVSAWARYPGWVNNVKSVVIEIECTVVRKL